MYQIEDFVENAVRAVATSTLNTLQKRNLIHTLFEMQGYGDCSFTNLRTIKEMIGCSYSFAFDAEEMYNYKEYPELYGGDRYCYGEGDVYYDTEAAKYCVDSGSPAWEEMVAAGAITGDGAVPVQAMPHIEALGQIKDVMGDMNGYTRNSFYFLIIITGAFGNMTDDDCMTIFGKTKAEAESMLNDDDDHDDEEDTEGLSAEDLQARADIATQKYLDQYADMLEEIGQTKLAKIIRDGK